MKKTRSPILPSVNPKGFTLIELMFTLAIAGILLGIAAPNMRTFILNNRISSTTNEFLRSLQTARSEASKRQKNVVVCMTASITTPSCATSGYVGWIIFEDANGDWTYQTSESLLETHSFESDKIKLLADQGKIVSYASTGFGSVSGGSTATTNSTAVVVCDSRGNVDASGGTTGLSVARGIVISLTGRARITRTINSSTDVNDIHDLLDTGKINSSC